MVGSKGMALLNFIVFEGIDGSGKTTQLKILQKRLESVPSFITAEPTNLKTGIFLRSILKGDIMVHPITVVHLFAADRAEHLYGNGGIVERCHKGEICICDRYLFSNLAYQGITCGEEIPAKLNADFPLPQIVFYFDINPDISLKRMASRNVTEIYEKKDFLEKTSAEYRKIFDRYSKIPLDISSNILQNTPAMQIVTIDATQSEKDIAQIIWSHIEPITGTVE